MDAKIRPAVFLSSARKETDGARGVADLLGALGIEGWFEPAPAIGLV